MPRLSCLKVTLVFLIPLLLCSCKVRLPPIIVSSQLQPLNDAELWRERLVQDTISDDAVDKILLRADTSSTEGGFSAKYLLQYESSSIFRLEAFPSAGAEKLFALVANGQEVTLVDFQQAVFSRYQWGEGSAEKIFSFPLQDSQFIPVLAGQISEELLEASQLFALGSDRLVARIPTERMHFIFERQLLRLLAVEFHSNRGRALLQARYQYDGDARRYSNIEVRAPHYEFQLSAQVLKRTSNQPISPELFELPPLNGYREVASY